jgi:hypothetical protein
MSLPRSPALARARALFHLHFRAASVTKTRRVEATKPAAWQVQNRRKNPFDF